MKSAKIIHDGQQATVNEMALREGCVENKGLLRDKPMARHTAQKPDTLTVINWRQKE